MISAKRITRNDKSFFSVLRVFTLALIFIISLFATTPAEAATLSHGAVLGGLTDTSVKVWIRTDSAATFKVEYKLAAAAYPGTITSGLSLTSGNDFTGTITITGLTADTAYAYRVLVDDATQSGNGSSGTFTTLKASGSACHYVFSATGDFNTPSVGTLAFNDVLATATPLFNLFMGDQIYGPSTSATKSDLEGYYKANWADDSFRTFTKAVPSVAMWDDHELPYSANWDRGKGDTYSSIYFPVANEYQFGLNFTPRVPGSTYFDFTVCDTAFFIADARSYRSLNTANDSAGNRMFGSAQMAHIKSWLKNSPAQFKFILVGVNTSASTSGVTDKYYTFNSERMELYDFIAKNNIKNVMVLSGDQHNVTVNKNPVSPTTNYWDLNATPLGSPPYGTAPDILGSDLLCYNTVANKHYAIIDVDTTLGTPQVHWKGYKVVAGGADVAVCDYTLSQVTSFSTTGPTVSSGTNQTFTIGAGTTSANTITITDAATPTINTTDDIRIRIPDETHMVWDSSITTATIGGGASAKVSTTVSYEENNKVVVLNVTSAFTASNSITVGGLKFMTFSGVSSPQYLGVDIDNNGGADVFDSQTVTVNASATAGLSSEMNQAFSVSQSAQAIKTITVVDGQTPAITSLNDIRIIIPAGVPMEWDTADTTATIGGGASGKVSTTVSYPNAKTLLLDVTSNFSGSDYITIAGLSFKNFTSTVAATSLGMDTTGDSTSDTSDFYTVRIVSSTTRLWHGGGKSNLWSDATNWSGNVAPVAGDAVLFDSTKNEDVTADYVANNLGSITLDTGFTSLVHFSPYAVENTLGSLTVSGAITVNAGHLRFESDQHIDAYPDSVEIDGTGYTISAGSISIGASGRMSADSMGFPQGIGPGAVGGTASPGGSYGGRGGFGSTYTSTPGAPYGSAASPVSLGSGGGAGSSDVGNGGAGGGALKISASTITVNGTLSANGEDPSVSLVSTSFRNAAGSGGSIWISSGTVSGSGTISANGGNVPLNTDTTNSGAGGGGRISFNGATYSFSGGVQVLGGTMNTSSTINGTNGHAGTIYFPAATLANFTPGASLTLGNDLQQTFGNITIPTGVTLTLDGDEILNTGYTLTATNITIDNGGTITATGKGYSSGNTNGPGVNTVGADSARSSGASYGGRGGYNNTSYGGSAGAKYGSASSPTDLGSGANTTGGGRGKSGYGGGAIKIVASGTTTVNGTLSANGTNGVASRGGGSGGSIWISSGTVTGAGSITANGGSPTSSEGGAGGGGRISLNGATLSSYTGTYQVAGGTVTTTLNNGGYMGHAGTVYFPTSLQNPSSSFTLSNALTLGNDIDYTFGNLTIASGGTLVFDSDIFANSGYGSGGTLNATNLTIASGGSLNVNFMGRHDLASYKNLSPAVEPATVGTGASCSNPRFNGGGYGGLGGWGNVATYNCPDPASSTSQTYGSSTAPTYLGSGHRAGSSTGSSLGSVNRGGGAIKLNISDTLTVNGTLAANGSVGSSGGSIWAITKNYAGTTGAITANGGASATGSATLSGNGGGGRIRLEYVNKTYSGTAPVAGVGTNTGSVSAASGTVSEATLTDTTVPTVSNISVSSISATGATITWETNELSSSIIDYGTTSSYGTATTETDTSPRVISHTVILSGLSGGTTYHFRITSKDDAGTPNVGQSTDQTFTTTSAPDSTPPVISNIVATPTNTAVTIEWDTDELSSSQVDYGTTASYGTTTTETDTSPRVTSHGISFGSLSPSTTYHYRVRSKDTALNSQQSSDQTFITSATPDTTAPVISAINATPTYNSVIITWDTDEGASSIVDYGPTASYGTTTSETDTSPRVTSHTVTFASLTPSTTYHFRVKSKDAALNLATSSDQTFTTSAAPDVTDPIISNISATPTDSAVTITWDTDEAASTQLEYGASTSYGTTTSLVDTSPRVTSHSVTFSGLLPGTLYHFRVISEDASSNSATSSDQTFTTSIIPDTTPPIISLVTATADTTTATITWETDEGSSSIIVYGATTSYGIETVEADTSPLVTTHSVILTGLSSGVTYHFRVKSNDSAANLATSSDNTFTTIAAVSSGGGGGGGGGRVIIVPTPTSPATPSSSTSQASSIPFFITRKLMSGSVGKDVKMLQVFLNAHGFTVARTGAGSAGKETEKFGVATRNAVKAFQKKYKLFADGVIGPKTRTIMLEVYTKNK